MTVPSGRVDWSEIRDRVDLAAVATALLGPAVGRRGERSRRRLWWPCPFHDDQNPSFAIEPGKPWWKCFGCSEHGDAATLVMKLQGVSFPEAVRWLAEQAGIVPASRNSTRPRPPAAKPGKAPAAAPDTPSGLPVADALSLVTEAAGRLWTPEGAKALAYLKGRGLTEETIRSARLGWTLEVWLPTREGDRYFRESGITIPWHENGRLACVNIRRAEGKEPKYREAFRDRRTLFPDPAVIKPGKPLIIVEGELDCLLMAQELGDLASVVTLGSASSKPEGDIYLAMLPAPDWYLGHDADPAGDRAASGWPARAIRVRPPSRHKDWGELHAAGCNLIPYLWIGILGHRTPWDELAQRRWGPGLSDPTPGIIIGPRQTR